MANLCLVCFVMLHGLVTRECVPASAGRQGGGGVYNRDYDIMQD